MTQWWPAFLAAIASFIGALVAWLGPYRNAQIERDNRLRALYGDIIKEMLALELLIETGIDDAPPARESSPEAITADRMRWRAFDDAYALLRVEPYPMVASVIAAVDAYRGAVREREPRVVEPSEPDEFDQLLRATQYAMGRRCYARTPWGRMQLRRALGDSSPPPKASQTTVATPNTRIWRWLSRVNTAAEHANTG
jgi:hypothetical protein